MYLPSQFAERDPERLFGLVEAHPFGTLVEFGSGEVSHLPFLLDRSGGARGTLLFHLSRANPMSRLLDGERPATAIFLGPQGYVSPRWYEERAEVPTWNYAAVHVRGRPRRVADARPLLRAMTERFEAFGADRWGMEEIPEPLLEDLLRGITAFAMEAETIEGKFKLSQNRSAADRAGAIRGLTLRRAPGDVDLARLMAGG